MKKIVMVILALLVASFSTSYAADRYCEWSGTEGINCVSPNSIGHYRIPGRVKTANPVRLNEYGYYIMTTTQPVIGEDQVRDAEVWGFADNEITLTWTVRDMTATEIDNRIASPMSIEMYWVWKALTHPVRGIMTQAEAATILPQAMIDAYQARARLLGD